VRACPGVRGRVGRANETRKLRDSRFGLLGSRDRIARKPRRERGLRTRPTPLRARVPARRQGPSRRAACRSVRGDPTWRMR
jgi:hypothetical protein